MNPDLKFIFLFGKLAQERSFVTTHQTLENYRSIRYR